MPEASLKNKTVNGVGWSAADAILGQGVTFLVGIILARLLSPTEYGLIGIISIFIVVLNGVVDGIQKIAETSKTLSENTQVQAEAVDKEIRDAAKRMLHLLFYTKSIV